ncbi:FtsX-like permease family protein [Anaerosporobacter faecicola]|uniref:FtsX-like permease family protein n=1 Tax=Anaerosporobacter faecicola TaxID=2718714 RepID=UPI001438E7E6|nr:ABC transporter permease [Anaerosporobacter faecicola]
MFAKLAMRNAIRSAKDYLVYVITLVLCVGMFYSFMAITSPHYQQSLPVGYDLVLLKRMLRIPVILITLLITFLVLYVNSYMLKKKQRMFGVQIVLGMEQKTAGTLFFFETALISGVSILLGILLGTVFMQLVTSVIMHSFGESYQFLFALYPDTVGITVCVFLCSFFIVGIANAIRIGRKKIIDFLTADKLNEGRKKEFFMPILTLVYLGISMQFAYESIQLFSDFQEKMQAGDLSVLQQVMLYSALILPVLNIMTGILYIFFSIKKKKLCSFQKLLLVYAVESLCFVVLSLMIAGKGLPIPIQKIAVYFLYGIGYFIFFIFAFFYSISEALGIWKEKSDHFKYEQNRLFLIGQINTKLRSNSRLMGILSGALLLAIVSFLIEPFMTGWALGYLEQRAAYDIQLSTSLQGEEQNEEVETIIREALKQQGYELGEYAVVERVLLDETAITVEKQEDPVQYRREINQQMLAMSLSDYNNIRLMAGLKVIQLQPGYYASHYSHSMNPDKIPALQEEIGILTCGGKQYEPGHWDQDPMGEALTNGPMDNIVILPDEAMKNRKVVSKNYYGKPTKTMTYDAAVQVELAIYDQMEQLVERTDDTMWLRMRTVQRNQGINMAVLMKLLFFYGGVILFIIIFTILSLQQLSDAEVFKNRFQIIMRLGVSKRSVDQIILSQMGLWFGLPILLAIIAASFFVRFCFTVFRDVITVYIGQDQLAQSVAIAAGIMASIAVCYFVVTWILFKRNIEETK